MSAGISTVKALPWPGLLSMQANSLGEFM